LALLSQKYIVQIDNISYNDGFKIKSAFKIFTHVLSILFLWNKTIEIFNKYKVGQNRVGEKSRVYL
jgi:hypothetical protein